MITREELSFFAEFCQAKYQINVDLNIIEDFLQTFDAKNHHDIENRSKDGSNIKSCSSNNIDCTHITFHSAKCDECPN